MTRITTFADPEATAERAAIEIVRALQSAREQRGVAHLALSGGSTPARTYELLASAVDEWDGVEIWFADERCVGPEDAESNYRLAAETLLRPAGIEPARVHRMEGELGPEEGAQRYAEALRAGFTPEQTSPPSSPALPVLDLIALGIGPDGHVASLFPGAPTLDAGDAGDLSGRARIAQAAARANHAEPRGTARRAALPAAGDRRRQGRRDRGGARRADQPRSGEPARARAADGNRRRRCLPSSGPGVASRCSLCVITNL